MTDTIAEQETLLPPAAEPTVAPAKRLWPLWCAGLIVALLAWNATVAIPVMSPLSDEEGATTVAYRRWLVSPNQIVAREKLVSQDWVAAGLCLTA